MYTIKRKGTFGVCKDKVERYRAIRSYEIGRPKSEQHSPKRLVGYVPLVAINVRDLEQTASGTQQRANDDRMPPLLGLSV